jgi:hypothetical protein
MIQRLLLLAALSIPWQPTLWAGGKKVLLDAGHARIVYLDSGKTALQTQNLSFRKGNTRVAVISAAHVGTLDYYAAICRYLHQHHFDTVLYEDIHSHADLVELKRTCGGDYRLLHDRMPQLQVAQILGLAFQWDAMDFHPQPGSGSPSPLSRVGCPKCGPEGCRPGPDHRRRHV